MRGHYFSSYHEGSSAYAPHRQVTQRPLLSLLEEDTHQQQHEVVTIEDLTSPAHS